MEKTIKFNGDTGKAFEIVKTTFLPLGFKVVTNTDESIKLTGTGSPVANGQNLLAGVSEISVTRAGDELLLEAEFGGIRITVIFMIVLILSMAVLFAIVFGVIATQQGQSMPKALLLPLAPLIPWPVLIPCIAAFMKSRASKLLDVLLENMASV